MKQTEFIYIPRWRILILAGLVIIAMTILLVKLWEVQISQGETYVTKLRDQTTIAVRLSPARGAILDRNGIPLAENRASFDVDFYLDELVRNYKRQHRGKVPTTLMPRRQGGKTIHRSEPDVYQIVSEGAEQLSKILGVQVELDPKELQNHYYQTPNIPFQFRSNVDFATLARFSEHSLGIPGIEVAARPVRFYNFGALAPHLIGYVGLPSDKERMAPDGQEYETVGHAGIERVLDGQLQGTPGGRISRVNYKGYIVNEEDYNPPSVGNSVYLTLDARIQMIVEEVMRNVGRGAAVVIDPNNGDILAMVSVPSFDPNAFIPKVTTAQWNQWNTDPTAPLLNRAISTYAPGSTFKIVTALAALKTGAIRPLDVWPCPPSIDYGGTIFKDHTGLQPNGLGSGNLFDALRVSCNVYFYQVGNKAGIKAIDDIGDLFGLGKPTGIPIPAEGGGILPGPEWFKIHRPKDRWTSAKTANISIGQGDLLVTPLQMSTVIGAVANGGTIYYPRLTVGVSSLAGETIVSVPPRVRGELGLKTEDMQALRQALLGCVQSGTGKRVQVTGVDIAGKTGSAQFNTRINGSAVKDTRAWFVGFAPYEAPRYAFAVMVEGGKSGGGTAGPLTHEILQRIFDMERTGVMPEMNYLTPAIGNFTGVSEYVAPDSAAGGATGTTLPGSVDTSGAAPDLVNENDAGAPSMVPSTTNKSRSRAYSR